MAKQRAKQRVVIGLLGTRLDAGRSGKRWKRWRPTVDLCAHPDFPVARLELLYDAPYLDLAQQVRADVAEVSPATEVVTHELGLKDPWDFEEVYACLFDYGRERSPGRNEDLLVHMTTGTHVAQICWFLLCESRHLPARLLQTAPPVPRTSDELGTLNVIDLDLSRYEQLAARFSAVHAEGRSALKGGIPTRNAAFNSLIEELETVALASREPILLQGPTGAGKSQLARRVYALKRERGQVEGELVEVNCATLRGDAAMSALFGHTRGAFTGAAEDRAGLLRRADGGVLFLDEIGELGLDEQAMLLRALEVGRYLPLGSDREVESDFQLLAGTNRELSDPVTFRPDLLARIDLWSFRLPPLRDRPEDLEPNLEHELADVSARGDRVAFTRPARKAYLDFAVGAPWTRNFRDLRASVRRMSTLCTGGQITLDDVRRETQRLRAAWSTGPAAGKTPDDDLLSEVLGAEGAAQLDRYEAVQLADVIRVVRETPSLSAAGRVLFAASRARRKSTNDADRLRKYLARFELDAKALRR